VSGFQSKADFIWSVADEILRDDFKRSRYADVILPFTVLRRIDCTLAPTKERVLERYEELKGRGLEKLDDPLRRVSGYFYSNTSNYTFEKLLEDPKNVGPNLRDYINGFGEEMGEVLERFKLRITIDTLEEKGLLYQVIQKFNGVDLHP
jgi:type I restriction enzyme M protein